MYFPLTEWLSWSEWSQCTKTCNNGTQERIRVCSEEGLCDGSDRDQRKCFNGTCRGIKKDS